MTKRIIYTIALIAVINSISLAQMSQQWVNRFDSTAKKGDTPAGIVLDKDGNVIIALTTFVDLSSTDFMVVKFNPSGSVLWHKKVNERTYDVTKALGVDKYGNIYVTGARVELNESDMVTFKYSPDGQLMWLKTYGTPNNVDSAVSMAVDDFGNVFVLGQTYSSATGLDYVTISYTPNGHENWAKKYDHVLPPPYSSFDIPKKIAIAKDNIGNVSKIYVTGTSEDVNNNDISTICYSTSGYQYWEHRFDGAAHNSDRAFDIDVDDFLSDKIYVCGYEGGSNINNADYITICIAEDGSTLWTKKYNGPNNFNDIATSVFADRSGENYVFVTGKADGNNAPNITTICYRNSSELWSSTYDGPASFFDMGNDIAYDYKRKLVYVAGVCTGTGGSLDFCLLQYNLNGTLNSVKTYNNLAFNGSDIGMFVCADTNGNVVVTGTSQAAGDATYNSLLSVKYTSIIGIQSISGNIPANYNLAQNYPNPFNPSTKIVFDIPTATNVKIEVFDITGKRVEELVNENVKAGSYEVEWNASKLSSGTYFYRMQAGSFTETKKMILIK